MSSNLVTRLFLIQKTNLIKSRMNMMERMIVPTAMKTVPLMSLWRATNGDISVGTIVGTEYCVVVVVVETPGTAGITTEGMLAPKAEPIKANRIALTIFGKRMRWTSVELANAN